MVTPGRLDQIFVIPRRGAEPVERAEVRAVAGAGLEGDRYFGPPTRRPPGKAGTPAPQREVTLIEAEALELLARDADLLLTPAQARRNLVTRGVALNHLVGQTFRVGAATLRGLALCQPCSRLAALTTRRVVRALWNQGGLRAEVVRDGLLRVGDPVEIASAARS